MDPFPIPLLFPTTTKDRRIELELRLLVEELESGAYDYLVHLILEVPSLVDVVKDELARLRTCFQTSRVSILEESTPDVALPPYCVKPESWQGEESRSYALSL
ncbi:hypothetical protein C8Q77DRAFT_1151859 [Trametes polyzona]|nr:hypothetical protein C8Q77DRAFT_1151859 [Trametes polyzona]